MSISSLPILEIDLASGAQRLRETEPDIYRDFLGGSSLAAHVLYASLLAGLDPLSPEAPLLFMAGPLTGCLGISAGRYVICAKSPQTGLWGESNAGGFVGPALRAAGYDGLLFTGRAPEPVYLWLDDGGVEIRSAAHLWGVTDTYETQERIKDELGKPGIRVANIGRAGEERIPFASVLCDHGRAAGRTGMGAVMGAKNLKAIAVSGTKQFAVAQEQEFERLRQELVEVLRDDPLSKNMRELGTAGALDYAEFLGSLPKHNFTCGVAEQAGSISGATMSETILSGRSTCHGCIITCGRRVRLSDGAERKGPEYETAAGFGANLGIFDLAAITRLGELCDRYGVDQITLSHTIALAMLLHERGMLSGADLGRDELHWGDVEGVERLIHSCVRREGIGEMLALGARGMAQKLGVPELAVQVNGLELGYHDPRGLSGMALVYATSPIGGSHNQSDYYTVDMVGQTHEEIGICYFDRQAGAEKAPGVAKHQDWRAMCNALILCHFANLRPREVLGLVNAATGLDYSLDELLAVGERAWNLKRAINCRLGLRREEERLPGVLMQPLPDGGAAGYVPPVEEMLRTYYQVRDWDPETGRPRREKLHALGLEGVAEDLWGPEAA
jgi:aldehyde:ferredoxin oxidoreductase